MSAFNLVRRVVAENSAIRPEEISLDTRLDELGVDSLEFIEMMIQVQNECGVQISDEQIARMTTVGDLCKAVAMCPV